MMAGDFNNFSSITAKMHKAVSQIVHDTCQNLDNTYAATCARRTGFMASSAYISTVQENTYADNLEGGTDEALANMFDNIGDPENDTTGYMAVAANYAVYVELGSVHGPAQPAFYPAVETVRPEFIRDLSNLESHLK